MSDISLQLTIKEENSVMFKRCVRMLLDGTFVLRERDERFYNYLARESNRQDISAYLQVIGFDLLLEDKAGVAMLVASENDEDTVGLKRANIISFTPLQYHLLLILWKVYLENVGYNEGVYVTKGDLIEKIKSYGVTPVRTEFAAALKLFKKYSLLNYNENEEVEKDEDRQIQLYASLQFGWDLPQFKTVVEEYVKLDASEAEAETESEEEAEG